MLRATCVQYVCSKSALWAVIQGPNAWQLALQQDADHEVHHYQSQETWGKDQAQVRGAGKGLKDQVSYTTFS